MPNFGKIGGILDNAAVPLANTIAANNEATKQQAIRDLMAKRQAAEDARAAALNSAQVGYYNARAGGQWKLAPDGIHQFNTDTGEYRVPPPAGGSPGPNTALGPVPPVPPAPGGDAFAMRPWSLNGVKPVPPSLVPPGASPAPTAALGPAATQSSADTAAPINFGKPPVLRPVPRVMPHATTAMIAGRPVIGGANSQGLFTPDTTAAGDTVYGKPPATGAGDASSGLPLNRTLANLRGQITQTDVQLRAAQNQARAANDPLSPPAARAQAVGAAAHAAMLQQRLDSLTSVHDRLSAQQQGAAGAAPSVTPPASPAPPFRTPTSPDQMRQMQSEFDDASNDLTAVLNSNAPPEIKARARALYDQHQATIAQKYRAMQPAVGGSPSTPPLDE